MSSWTFSAPGGGSSGRLFRAALLCLVAYCAVNAVLLAIGSINLVPLHRDAVYTESSGVESAILAGQSGRLYHRLDAPPYSPQQYGPLFYSYSAALGRLAHFDLPRLFLFGRLFTFATYLLCAPVIFQICRRLRVPAWQAALSAALFLALPPYHYDVAVRPDFPSLLLMLLSLFYAIRKEAAGPLAYVPAGIFAGAAFLVKQSGIAVLIAIAAVLLSKRKYRQTVVLAVSAVAPIALALLVLLWRHEPFWDQFTVIGKSLWSFRDGVFWTIHIFRDFDLIIPVGIFCLGFPIAAGCEERTQMVVSFTLVNFCAAAAAIAQMLGDVNYFFPAAAGAALLLPFAFELVAQSGKRFQAAVCALMIVWLPLAFLRGARPRWNDARAPLGQPALPLQDLRKLRIFSDIPYFTLLGRQPEFLDPLLFHSLELAGHWDARPLAENIRDAKYDLVIVAQGEPAIGAYRGVSWFGSEVVDALNRNYERFCEAPAVFKPALVLQPRNRVAPVTVEMMSQTLGRPCLPEPGRSPGLFLRDSAR